MYSKKPITILMADDNIHDRLLTQRALEQNRLVNDLRFVEDGEELMDYLHHRGKYSDPISAPRPGVILLDLNMPKKDGRESLKEIKSDPELRRIPVIALTNSTLEEDLLKTYGLGVNAYIPKPVNFNELVKAMKVTSNYWLEIVELPDHE